MVLFNTLLLSVPPYHELTANNKANTEITIPALSFNFASRSEREPAGGLTAFGSFGCLVIRFNTLSNNAMLYS
jgi:hypothetical protein